MTKIYYLPLFFLFIFLGNIHAQPKCGSQRLHENRLYNEPEYAKSWEQFQRQRIEWMNQAQSRTDGTNCQGGIKTIPVAIHYDYMPANAQERTCLINLANSQIAHLNQAYTGQLCMEASGTTSSSGGCLNFVIANQNHPAGSGLMNGQPAILFGGNACPNGQDAMNPNQPDYNLCALPAWKGYLNIVVKDPIPNMTLGIASTGNASTLDLPADGTVNTMVISSCAFGVGTTNCAPNFPGSNFCRTNYSTNIGGTTVTHELGHFFGLPHTFCSDQDGMPSNSEITGALPNCPTNNCDCDGFADTPAQAYAEHTVPCDIAGGVLPNPITGMPYSYNNFMDYVDDKCMTCFSTMQANQIRMRARHPDNNVKPNVFMVGNNQTCPNGQAMQAQGTACDDGNANTMNDMVQADGCTCTGMAMPMNLCGDGTAKLAPGTPCGVNNAGQIDTDSCACVAVMQPMNLCPDGFPKAAPGSDCSGGGETAQIGADSCSCFIVDGAPPIAGDGAENWCVDVAEFAGGEGQIIVSNLITEREIISVIGAGTNWQERIVCDGNCDDNQIINNLTAGSYQVKLQMFESSDNSYCYREETIVVTGGDIDIGGNEVDCNNVLISSTDNQIDVNNLPPNAILKVYLVKSNGGWDLMGDCSGDCGASKTFPNLQNGNYLVNVELYTAHFREKICANAINIPVGTGTNGDNNPSCDDITFTTSNGRIKIAGINAPVAQIKLYKVKTGGGWDLVERCNADCGTEQTFANLSDGNYMVDIILYSANYATRICGLNQMVTLGNALNTPTGSRSTQLLELVAYKNKRAVDLQWLTNTGYKNTSFEIEKSTDGQHFTSLLKVANTIKEVRTITYKETDENPKIGMNYYRLKQFYTDGSFDYTPIQPVNFDWDVNAISLFPNPAKDILNINLGQKIAKKVSVHIMDALGKLYVERNFEKLEDNVLQIPIQELNNGLYHISIKMDNQPILTKKLIVNQWY